MEILIKALIISLFCVGLRITSDDGMILSFIRMPYVWLESKELNFWGKLAHYLLKPIIGCITCMASVWSITIDYYYFHYFNKWTILLIFVVACLNTMIYRLYEKLD